MTASELLHALRVRGAEVRLDGGDIVVRARRGAVSPGLRAALIELKPALLAELAKRPRHGGDRPGSVRGCAVPAAAGVGANTELVAGGHLDGLITFLVPSRGHEVNVRLIPLFSVMDDQTPYGSWDISY